MFKITHNTVRQFSLAEILMMVAMNLIEATDTVGKTKRTCPRDA